MLVNDIKLFYFTHNIKMAKAGSTLPPFFPFIPVKEIGTTKIYNISHYILYILYCIWKKNLMSMATVRQQRNV